MTRRQPGPLLRQAGYDSNNPVETNMFVLDMQQYSGGPDVIESVASMWADVGVKVNLRTVDRATRLNRGRALDYNNHITLGVLIAPPILALRLGHHTSPPRGGGAEDFVVEEVFEKARRSLDLTVQNQFIQEATDRIYDEYMAMPLFWVPVTRWSTRTWWTTGSSLAPCPALGRTSGTSEVRASNELRLQRSEVKIAPRP